MAEIKPKIKMTTTILPYIQLFLVSYGKIYTIKRLSQGLWIFLIFSILTEILFPHVILAQEDSMPLYENEEVIIIPARRGMALSDEPQKTPLEIVKTGSVWATAYSSTQDQTDSTPFITANGREVYDGLIAANFLSFGTKVRFPEMFGEKIFTVNDRMNQRYHYRIDVWMPSREEAIQFGVQKMRYEVLQE